VFSVAKIYLRLLKKEYCNKASTAKVLPPAGGGDLGGAKILATD
jgi:hypothetical protein